MIRAATVYGAYRYGLLRGWAEGRGIALWIMLNPSTADDKVDDPTIRRCIGFSRAWGCAGLVVVNLFALRSTDPKALSAARDPCGPDNDAWIRWWASVCPRFVVAAWGSLGGLRGRDEEVLALFEGVEVSCLGVTKAGNPRHPLYVKGSTPLRPYP
jgi:hypothetical protein